MVAFLMAVASVTLYGCSAGLCAFRTIRKSDRFPVAARLLFLAAFLLHSASIGVVVGEHFGNYSSAARIFHACILGACLGVAFRIRCKPPAVWVSGHRVGNGIAFHPLSQTILMASGYALYALAPTSSGRRSLCIFCFSWVATACFVISAAASAMQLYQRRLMKARSARLLSLSMPAIETLNRVAKRAALVGFPLFTLGMLIGFGRYAMYHGAMVALGCPAGFSYLWPRIGLSLAVLPSSPHSWRYRISCPMWRARKCALCFLSAVFWERCCSCL